MAGNWIKFDTSTSDKPEVWAIATKLEIDPDAVVGKLLRIWAWFDDHSEKGNAPIVTRALLDRRVGVTGFVTAMIEAGWMVEENNALSLPNFERHNGQTAKNRVLTAKRVAEHKKSNAKGNAPIVTRALPKEEKSRGEKNTNKQTSDDHSSNPSRELSSHWPSSEFRSVWFAWLSHVAAKDSPVTSSAEEIMLYELARFSTEEAIAVVRFSVLKQAKNLILNGDHKPKQQSQSNHGNRSSGPVSFEEGLLK
jgi:hypothetical protein